MSNQPLPQPLRQEQGVRTPTNEDSVEPVDQIRQQNDAAREQAQREKDLEKVAQETPPAPPPPLGSTVEPPRGDQWVG